MQEIPTQWLLIARSIKYPEAFIGRCDNTLSFSH
jgi:hypothetical protein